MIKIGLLKLSLFIIATGFKPASPVRNILPLLLSNDTTPKAQQNAYKDLREMALAMKPRQVRPENSPYTNESIWRSDGLAYG